LIIQKYPEIPEENNCTPLFLLKKTFPLKSHSFYSNHSEESTVSKLAKKSPFHLILFDFPVPTTNIKASHLKDPYRYTRK